MPDAEERTRCVIAVSRKAGRIGFRQEAQHVVTGEWVSLGPLMEMPDGQADCYLGRLERLAPEGMNIRVIFEEMP